VFIPDDPRLRVHAFRIADARRHVLHPPVEADDDPVADLERDLAEAAAAEAEPPEQLSLFSVLSAVATGVSVHAFTEDGLTLLDDAGHADAFDDEPDVPEPDGAGGDVELEDVPTALGYVAAGRISVGERKELLRARNATLTRALVDRTGWTFGRINAELNKAVGITSVGGATNEQLERRAKRADGWVRTGRL
jgi:hypothetical protein